MSTALQQEPARVSAPAAPRAAHDAPPTSAGALTAGGGRGLPRAAGGAKHRRAGCSLVCPPSNTGPKTAPHRRKGNVCYRFAQLGAPTRQPEGHTRLRVTLPSGEIVLSH